MKDIIVTIHLKQTTQSFEGVCELTDLMLKDWFGKDVNYYFDAEVVKPMLWQRMKKLFV